MEWQNTESVNWKKALGNNKKCRANRQLVRVIVVEGKQILIIEIVSAL